MSKFVCWSEEHPAEGEETIDAPRASQAAKDWLDDRWWRLGHPDEVRVFVRDGAGRLFAYDVHVEEVVLDLTAMRVVLNKDGRPMSAEEMQRALDARKQEAQEVLTRRFVGEQE